MSDHNDPLAGVPAVDWSSCFDAWWEVYHESPPHVVGDLPATTLEHIQWERQQNDALRARVERLRRAFKQAASADHGGEGWAVGGYGLEPGDLEEGNNG